MASAVLLVLLAIASLRNEGCFFSVVGLPKLASEQTDDGEETNGAAIAIARGFFGFCQKRLCILSSEEIVHPFVRRDCASFRQKRVRILFVRRGYASFFVRRDCASFRQKRVRILFVRRGYASFFVRRDCASFCQKRVRIPLSEEIVHPFVRRESAFFLSEEGMHPFLSEEIVHPFVRRESAFFLSEEGMHPFLSEEIVHLCLLLR
ncbi:hypothetical protein [Prevotella lacticifex]|uniref:hypothetical protein n=1 Tax=Prevotella lacticifex TaxID=2854755 RepID=UPI001CC3C21B|nr:hypothetical protein [Prevotella lacticifex]